MPRHVFFRKTYSKFWRRLRSQRRIHQRFSSLTARLSAFSMVLNIDDILAQRSTISFDSDASTVICDNSANVHVCNNKNMFVRKIRPLKSHAVATIRGSENQAAGIGDVQWRWKDDTGQEHTHRIQNIFYFNNSPINILSITDFANELNDDNGTRIMTF